MASSPSGLFRNLNLSFGDAVQPESSSIDTTFLTPPITPRSEDDIPFKPNDTDTISLSMKRRHRDGHNRPSHYRTARACVSTSGVAETGVNPPIPDNTALAHSKSMPSLGVWSNIPLPKYELVASKKIRHHSIQSRPRRWTLPNKASPTRGFTTLKPTFKHLTAAENTEASPSPAMITLRRATVKSPHPTNITFFPPPTFSRARSSFMSCFSKSMAGENEETTENLDFLAKQVSREHHQRSICMALGTAQPTISVAARALVTQVAPSGSFIDTNQLHRMRRCSTQYVCSVTPYEIIWDEDNTPSSESESSSSLALASGRSQGISTLANRRRSVAVDQLEVQFSKAFSQSRRSSHIGTKDKISGSRRASFQRLIDNKFSRLFHNAALQNLPRSRRSKDSESSKPVSAPMNPAVHQTFDEEYRTSFSGKDAFFPPLRSRTGTSEIMWEQATHQDSTNKNTNRTVAVVRPRIGSMVGASAHLRRRSTVTREAQQRRRSKEPTWRRMSSTCGISCMTAETAPLLTAVGWEE